MEQNLLLFPGASTALTGTGVYVRSDADESTRIYKRTLSIIGGHVFTAKRGCLCLESDATGTERPLEGTRSATGHSGGEKVWEHAKAAGS